MPKTFKINVYIFIIAFVLNYAWETAHSGWYIPSPAIQASYSWYLLRAAAVDAVIIIGLYWLVALVSRHSYWIGRARWQNYGFVLLSGFAVSVFIEVRAVYFLNSWQYSAAMPLIPLLQIGLTSVLQMLVLPSLTFLLVKKLMKI